MDTCVGKKFTKVFARIDYIYKKIIARGELSVKHILTHQCYIHYGDNLEMTQSCDLLERDVLDLMWQRLPFIDILKVNKLKYIKEEGLLPIKKFDKILESLKSFNEKFSQLITEVNNHEMILMMHLKIIIDDKSKMHVKFVNKNSNAGFISVDESIEIKNPNKIPGLEYLPDKQISSDISLDSL